MKILKSIILSSMLLFLIFVVSACSNSKETEEIKNWTVSFDSKGGSSIEAIKVVEGTQIQKPSNPTYDGEHIFINWYKDSSFTTIVTWPYTVTKDETFYAKWNVNEYTLSLNSNGGSEIQPITEEYGKTIQKPNNPVKSGNEFLGWFNDQELNSAVTWPITLTANKSIYAKWDISKFTLNFNSNNGSQVSSIEDVYKSQINKPADPTRDGYRFLEWYQDEALTLPVSWPITLEENKTVHAAWTEIISASELLSMLLEGYKPDVFEFIPENLHPGASTLANGNAIDYSNFVNISSLPQGGYGEQWMMVLTNLQQSQTFFTSLDIVSELSSVVIAGYQAFLDNNPTDEVFVSQSGNYKFKVVVNSELMTLTIEYSTVQIHIEYNKTTGERNGRVQLSDANAMKFTFTEDNLTLTLKYLGVRRTYFDITKHSENNITGVMYEYLGNEEIYSTKSVATFNIDSNYLTVTGNKAGAMIGFKGYINELYLKSTGKLLGYEVEEILTVLGVEVKYNTMWFNASDITGFSSVKKVDEANNVNPDKVYVNGESSLFTPRKVGGLNTKRESRRYDIEFRTLYFYYYDSESKLQSIGLEIPMMFVQQDYVSSFNADVKATNSTLSNWNIAVSTAYQDKIKSDHVTYIPLFKEIYDLITPEAIVAYIGNKQDLQ